MKTFSRRSQWVDEILTGRFAAVFVLLLLANTGAAQVPGNATADVRTETSSTGDGDPRVKPVPDHVTGVFERSDFNKLNNRRMFPSAKKASDFIQAPVVTDDLLPKNDDDALPAEDMSFRWGSAIRQSLLFLSIQHGYALTQPKTREALKGKFLKDYAASVKSLHGWNDGGRFFTNYIAHPLQGSFMGFIQIQNDPKGSKQRFGPSADYWKSRMKAMAWSAAWSTQFEIGPLSQASIGNVGLYGKQTWIDLVVTPTVGTAFLITEDAIDRFVIERIERMSDNYYVMAFARMLLNPTRTMANIIRFKLPWYRDRKRLH